VKTCRDCGEAKSLEDFHRQPANRDGRAGHCKACAKVRARNYYRANQERLRAEGVLKQRERRQQGLDRETRRRRDLWKKYKITPEDWDRLYDEQLGRCAICLTTLAEVYRIHVDHDHRTGAVRGLLCPDCNHGLGKFGDDPETLVRASAYLVNAAATRMVAEQREEVSTQ